jgi:hypothetical protein
MPPIRLKTAPIHTARGFAATLTTRTRAACWWFAIAALALACSTAPEEVAGDAETPRGNTSFDASSMTNGGEVDAKAPTQAQDAGTASDSAMASTLDAGADATVQDASSSQLGSCIKGIFGRYLLRSDGTLRFQSDPPANTQTAVLNASTGRPLEDVASVVEGTQHGCALLASSKSVWCWPTTTTGNGAGQLGDGTTSNTVTPFRASQVLTSAGNPLAGVVSLAESTSSDGGNNACAVTQSGNLYCWGSIYFLTSNRLDSAFAVALTGDGVTPLGGVQQAAIARSFACVLRQVASTNEVACWGTNNVGNLGTGDTEPRKFATKVLGLTSPSKVFAYGSPSNTYYTAGTACAIDGGRVRCWGHNNLGQVGDGTRVTPVLAPKVVTLMDGITPVADIVDVRGGHGRGNGGYNHTCALTAAHSMLCWGHPFEDYPTAFPAAEVAGIGSLDDYATRYLTLDGLYHYVPTNNDPATVRSPDCGPFN